MADVWAVHDLVVALAISGVQERIARMSGHITCTTLS